VARVQENINLIQLSLSLYLQGRRRGRRAGHGRMGCLPAGVLHASCGASGLPPPRAEPARPPAAACRPVGQHRHRADDPRAHRFRDQLRHRCSRASVHSSMAGWLQPHCSHTQYEARVPSRQRPLLSLPPTQATPSAAPARRASSSAPPATARPRPPPATRAPGAA
jgi:hypothetical protein